jgi:hypothetical protein
VLWIVSNRSLQVFFKHWNCSLEVLKFLNANLESGLAGLETNHSLQVEFTPFDETSQVFFLHSNVAEFDETFQVFNPRTSQSLRRRHRLRRRRLRRRKLIERWFPAEQNGPIQRNTKFYGNLTRGKKQKLRLNCSLNILDFTLFLSHAFS